VCPYFLESFTGDHTGLPGWHAIIDALYAGRRIVRYDMRGSGLSQRNVEDVSLDRVVEDIEAVVRAAAIEAFDMLAWVLSSPAALEFTSRHPQLVSKLVVYAGFATNTDVMPEDALNGLALLCRTNWPLASQTLNDMSFRREAVDDALAQAGNLRQNTSGETLSGYLLLKYDLAESVRTIERPVLLLHRPGDGSVPFSTSQRLASLIPSARLVPLKGDVNYPGLGDVHELIDSIVGFFGEGTAPAERQLTTGAFRAVLFTDLVGHSEMMSRLGDERGRAVLREHEDITRTVLQQHGGNEVKSMGDGCMASFASVTKAVECAIALQRAFAEREGEPLSVRVGLNAGEPIEEDGDLFGATVILASRIAAKADGGEILVADTVRGLCSGKGFLFSDRGEFAAKGFEDPVRLYEVRWQD
jgi:class 3 adenylate cyclase/pimeloyl-ACP methyl ester carboxylesterase